MRLLSLAFAFLCAASQARAEIIIRSVTWQLPAPAALPARPRAYHEIARWIQPPSARALVKPRALVTVANRGPKPADGVVLRYALSAQLAKIGDNTPGPWIVPFYLNERRMARVGPNQTKDVPLNDLVLDLFLKKSYRAGYWPQALKIQVMVEPRAGEDLEQRIVEQALPVVSQ